MTIHINLCQTRGMIKCSTATVYSIFSTSNWTTKGMCTASCIDDFSNKIAKLSASVCLRMRGFSDVFLSFIETQHQIGFKLLGCPLNCMGVCQPSHNEAPQQPCSSAYLKLGKKAFPIHSYHIYFGKKTESCLYI